MAVKVLRYVSIVGMVCLFFLASVSFSHAKDKSTATKVMTVPVNQTVDNFFVFGHNATIDGTVRNLVLVVGGDLHVHPSAHVKELIIVIGGTVTQDQGTHVTENIFSFAWNKRVLDAFLFGGAILLSSWVVKLFVAVILVLFSTIASFFVPRSVEKQGLLGSWKLWLTGLIAALWILVLIVILAVTIVGIPIALLLLIIPVIAFFMSAGAISQEIGWRLIPERQGKWITTVLGAFVLTALLSFPLVGLLLYSALLVLSLGHLMLWVTEKWQQRKKHRPKEA